MKGTSMGTETLDIPALAAEFTAAHPKPEPFEQDLALAVFRLLARGAPFSAGELAEYAGLPPDRVASALDGLPMLQRDEQGRVVAYGGLTLEPTSHGFEVDGVSLHTWCALDTLFLPALLGRTAQVRSVDPHSGTEISLTVDPNGVRDVTPEAAVMTLHRACCLDVDDIVGNFCCHVHFFESEETAGEWAKRSEDTYAVSIGEGFEYGGLYNRGRFGAALARNP
jgi:alkylmercury lyase